MRYWLQFERAGPFDTALDWGAAWCKVEPDPTGVHDPVWVKISDMDAPLVAALTISDLDYFRMHLAPEFAVTVLGVDQ